MPRSAANKIFFSVHFAEHMIFAAMVKNRFVLAWLTAEHAPLSLPHLNSASIRLLEGLFLNRRSKTRKHAKFRTTASLTRPSTENSFPSTSGNLL